MIIFLIIALFLVSIIAFVLYLRKRKFFEKHKGIAEFLAVMVSLIFTLMALQQAQSSIDQSTNDFNKLITRIDTIVTNVGTVTSSIESVKTSLADLPSRIDTFSISIDSLNNIVTVQKKQLGNIITSLNGSIISFQSALDGFTQRFNRRPIISIEIKKTETDSTATIDAIVINNSGNLNADLRTLRFQIPEQNLISFNLDGFRETPKQDKNLAFQKDFSNQPIYHNVRKKRPLVLSCDIKLRKTNSFKITIFAYYEAALANDGDTLETFQFFDTLEDKPAKKATD